MATVTLLSDFGPGKYVAAMKGVILTIHPEATIVDLDHAIAPQNVREGAFVLAAVAPYYPPDTVHVAVVDPGVGSERRALVADCEGGTLVGPDNGLLLPAARRLGLKQVYEVTETAYCRPGVSDTFHGRDVFAPVGAHLSRGVAPDKVGPPVEDSITLDFGTYEVAGRTVRGHILYEDRFGNLETNIPEDALPDWIEVGRTLVLRLGKEYRLPFLRTYGDREVGRPLLTLSSDGFLEIAVNRGSAAELFGASPDDRVVLRKEGP